MYTRFGNLFCFQFKIINKYMYDIIRLWYSVINTKSMKLKKKKNVEFFFKQLYRYYSKRTFKIVFIIYFCIRKHVSIMKFNLYNLNFNTS